LENLKGTDHLGDLGIVERIILKYILNRMCRCRLDSTGSGQAPVVGSSEHSNESLFS